VMPPRTTGRVARKIFLIATEESGSLGASLMKCCDSALAVPSGLRASVASRWRAKAGVAVPIEELSIMGLGRW